jgi:beta-galactosidase/beta-glucuronidase
MTRPLIALPSSSISLSDAWRFAVDPGVSGETQGWATPGFDDSEWRAISVPHTWNSMPEYANFDGFGWYRRKFLVPEAVEPAHLRLRFEAVYYLARVWLNGSYLGEHEGGYTPFEFEVSGVIQPGAENVLVVQADNRRLPNRIPPTNRPEWSFQWWNDGGIVRDVSLLVTSRAFIVGQRIVAVPHLIGEDLADEATVTARVTVQNASTDQLTGTLSANIVDDFVGRAPKVPSPLTAPVSLAPGESVEVELSAVVASPKLWHFDHPNLYRWSTSLLNAEGQALHTDEVTFGIRSIELKGARFYFNGEPMRLAGLTRHQDSPEYGLAETAEIMAADYADLKALNTVFSRPAHYSQPEFILDYCDRHGILLIPEIPAWQLNPAQMTDPQIQELERQQIRETVAVNFNHASVWAWSLANEIESRTPEGNDFIREMIAYTKTLDPTRPVGFASNKLDIYPWLDATAQADFVMMNQYYGTWIGPKSGLGLALDSVNFSWPDKAVIASEYGFDPNWTEVPDMPPVPRDFKKFYFAPEGAPPDSDAADEPRRQVIADQTAVFRSRPFVVGAIFWTYQDYRSPFNFSMGVVDTQRNRRGSWEVVREEYSPILIDSVSLSHLTTGHQWAKINLRTRGLERDLPAYTLRGYRLYWSVTSQMTDDGRRMTNEEASCEGNISMPVLAPGSTWSGEMEWETPATDYVLTVSIVRPTGFTVIEHAYDAQGRRVVK